MDIMERKAQSMSKLEQEVSVKLRLDELLALTVGIGKNSLYGLNCALINDEWCVDDWPITFSQIKESCGRIYEKCLDILSEFEIMPSYVQH